MSHDDIPSLSSAPTMLGDGVSTKRPPVFDEPSLDSVPTMDGRDVSTKRQLGRIDQYELIRKLGGGGFGVVYLARDMVSGIEVALKTLHPLLKSNAEEMERLREKFALVSRLSHPNIATALVLHPVREVAIADDEARRELRLFPGDSVMVMRYAPGVTLSKWRRQFPDGKVPLDQVLEVGRQIASALDYAHGERIVHRDIKPANVMVETLPQPSDSQADFGLRVRILDFGLAAEIRSSMSRVSTEKGDTSGTRPYMAPEQWQGRRQDGRTDQYALACVLYELLSGEPPFAGAFETGDPAIMANAVENRQPDELEDFPAEVNDALQQALSKNQADRFGNCSGFVTALAAEKSPRLYVVASVDGEEVQGAVLTIWDQKVELPAQLQVETGWTIDPCTIQLDLPGRGKFNGKTESMTVDWKGTKSLIVPLSAITAPSSDTKDVAPEPHADAGDLVSLKCAKCGSTVEARRGEKKFCQRCGGAMFLALNGKLKDLKGVETASPHRRFSARLFDLLLGTQIAVLLLGLTFSDNTGMFNLVDGVLMQTFLYLPFALGIEALEYWAFGGTFGKWVFSVKVLDRRGESLGVSEYAHRLLPVYAVGNGLGVPVVLQIANIIQYGRVKKGLAASYDEKKGYMVVQYKQGIFKAFVAVLLVVALSAFQVFQKESLGDSAQTIRQSEPRLIPQSNSSDAETSFNKGEDYYLGRNIPANAEAMRLKEESEKTLAAIAEENERLAREKAETERNAKAEAERKAREEAERKAREHGGVQLWAGGPYWAETNIGAERPEDYGLYFWWGDTVGYHRVGDAWVASDGSSQNFEFVSGNAATYDRWFGALQNEGWTSSGGALTPEHDAANVHWGGGWRMPRWHESNDLNSNCDWMGTAKNGVKGFVVRGRGTYSKASIFLPAAGIGIGNSLRFAGSDGEYWLSDRDGHSQQSTSLLFYSGDHRTQTRLRYFGLPVRPVLGVAE